MRIIFAYIFIILSAQAFAEEWDGRVDRDVLNKRAYERDPEVLIAKNESEELSSREIVSWPSTERIVYRDRIKYVVEKPEQDVKINVTYTDN